MKNKDVTLHIGDVITEGDIQYRILYIRVDTAFVCIMNITKLDIRALVTTDITDGIMSHEFGQIVDSSSRIVDIDSLSDYEAEIYNRNKEIIEIVNNEYHPDYIRLMGKGSKPILTEIQHKYGITPATLWAIIRKYLQSGLKYNSLVPAKRTRSGKPAYTTKTGSPGKYGVTTRIVVDDVILGYFEEALEYYKSGRVKSLKSAYDKMNNLHFSTSRMLPDGSYQTGILLPITERPSERQFYYYCSQHITPEEKDRIKTSAMEARNNKRLLLGSSRTGVTHPGDYLEGDALEVDLSLISLEEADQTVSRPIVYALRDVYTMAIVAISVGYDNNSVIGLSNVMLNLCDDKIEYCARYGIELPDGRLWPSNFIPSHIRVDRGSDFKSKEFERMCNDLNITRELVSGGTGSLKGTIEQFFHQIHSKINPHTEDNGLIEKRFDSNHHKEAVLNITEFTRMLIQCVIQYNQRHMDSYTLTKDMIDKNIDATPITLWEYGCQYFGSPVPITDRNQYLYSLMCSGNAKVSRQGIYFKGLYYFNEEDESLLDTMRRVQNKRVAMSIRYDPRDATYIYYQDQGIMKRASLMEGRPGNADYKGMTFKEVDDYQHKKKLMDHEAKQRNDQIDADTFAVIDTEVKTAARRHEHFNNTSNIRETRESEKQAISHANSITARLEKTEVDAPEPADEQPKIANSDDVKSPARKRPKKAAKPADSQNNASGASEEPTSGTAADNNSESASKTTVTQDEYFKHLSEFADMF